MAPGLSVTKLTQSGILYAKEDFGAYPSTVPPDSLVGLHVSDLHPIVYDIDVLIDGVLRTYNKPNRHLFHSGGSPRMGVSIMGDEGSIIHFAFPLTNRY